MQSDENILKALGILNPEEHLYTNILASKVNQISDHIGLRKLIENDRILLAIIVDGKTVIKELKQNWAKVDEEREEIKNIQGIDTNDYFREILRQIFEKEYIRDYQSLCIENGIDIRSQKKSPSYNELIMDANFDLITFLFGVYKEPEQSDIRKLSEHLFRSLLISFNFSNEDINEFLQDGLDSIRLEKCPWDITNGPINKSKMREKIRYLKKKFKGHEASLKSSHSNNILLSVLNLFLRKKYWIEAKDLLNATFPSTYKKYEHRWNARTIEITSLYINK